MGSRAVTKEAVQVPGNHNFLDRRLRPVSCFLCPVGPESSRGRECCRSIGTVLLSTFHGPRVRVTVNLSVHVGSRDRPKPVRKDTVRPRTFPLRGLSDSSSDLDSDRPTVPTFPTDAVLDYGLRTYP